MEYITMSRKERTQLSVFEMLKDKQITQKEAAVRLKFSSRWVRTKYKRYLKGEAQGLVHRNRGSISKKRWNEQEKNLVLDLLRNEWMGFGPTFTAEKLAALKNVTVSKETVRRAMIEAGIWQAKCLKIKHRKKRERRAMVGQLVQFDGSPHDWFESRGERCTLLVFIDDAESKILWLEFVKSESTVDCMKATRNYVQHNGIPSAFYVDYSGVFSVNLNNKEGDKKTQWERACADLSIEIIKASSPQAKGRVERFNSTMQDRLVKEMRLAGVSSITEANKFIQESNFIARHNEKYAVPALEKGDAHRPYNAYDLNEIFCLKEERVLANDFTLVYYKRIFQLAPHQKTIIRPKNTIIVSAHLDGAITLSIRTIRLFFEELYQRPIKPTKEIILKQITLKKPSINSKRWASGLPPIKRELGEARLAGDRGNQC